ncbi:MAG: sulfatase arylsulfatase, partial [Planctomycetia bacterium]|nr:sulfatase arylsulfatase [Planctomycetia bacterium]
RKVHRSDKEYSGPATAMAPDLIMGWFAGYRASWDTCLGGMSTGVLSDNLNAWSADHCADPLEVPGIVFSNKPIRAGSPSLVDVAPTVLAEFGLETPSTMTGKNFFVK